MYAALWFRLKLLRRFVLAVSAAGDPAFSVAHSAVGEHFQLCITKHERTPVERRITAKLAAHLIFPTNVCGLVIEEPNQGHDDAAHDDAILHRIALGSLIIAQSGQIQTQGSLA